MARRTKKDRRPHPEYYKKKLGRPRLRDCPIKNFGKQRREQANRAEEGA